VLHQRAWRGSSNGAWRRLIQRIACSSSRYLAAGLQRSSWSRLCAARPRSATRRFTAHRNRRESAASLVPRRRSGTVRTPKSLDGRTRLPAVAVRGSAEVSSFLSCELEQARECFVSRAFSRRLPVSSPTRLVPIANLPTARPCRALDRAVRGDPRGMGRDRRRSHQERSSVDQESGQPHRGLGPAYEGR
jgi:hypothetical protein